jgi:O-antigen ligase
MENILKANRLWGWIGLSFFLIIVFSLDLSTLSKVAVVLAFAGSILLFYFIGKDISKGIILWFSVMLLFGQENLFEFKYLPNLPLERIVWALILLIFLFHIHKNKILPFTKIEYVMLLFLAICCFSMIKTVFNDDKKIRRFLIFLSFVTAYLVITGIFEKVLHLDYLVPHYYFIDPTLGTDHERFRGPFMNAAVNGTILVMLFHLSFYLCSILRGWKRRMMYLLLVSIPIVLFLTFTRSAWISFVVTLICVFLAHRQLRKKYLIPLFMVAVYVFMFLPNILSTDRTRGGMFYMDPVHSRIELHDVTFKMFKEKPILGHGFGEITALGKGIVLRTVDGNPTLASHNSFMSLLVELGSIGFILYALILYVIFKATIKSFKNPEESGYLSRSFTIIYWAVFITYVLNSLIIEMRYFLYVNALFFLLSGITNGLYQRRLIQEKNI